MANGALPRNAPFITESKTSVIDEDRPSGARAAFTPCSYTLFSEIKYNL